MIFLADSQNLQFFGVRDVVGCDEAWEIAGKDVNLRLATDCILKGYPMVSLRTDWFLEEPERLLGENFFRRDAKDVALELLGKILVHGGSAGIIVETEAYYGSKDPASRAYKGKKGYNSGMWLPGGHVFIYMVHANWMLNITTDMEDAQAVLIRALEPIAGIGKMHQRRGRRIRELCSGPGKLSQALGIERGLNGSPVGTSLKIYDSPWRDFEVARAHRIGVRFDLEEPLRFFIKGNPFVSVKKID